MSFRDSTGRLWLTRDDARQAEPIEGPLTKRQTSEARVGGGGYDWLLFQAARGDVMALEALRRALEEHDRAIGVARKVHIIRIDGR